MFEKARLELVRLKQLRDGLSQALDKRDFLRRFNEFIAVAQNVLIDLLKEGRGERLPGFSAWYARKLAEMDKDELVSMVREAEDHEFDAGPHRLRFVSGAEALTVDELGRPITEGVWWTLPQSPSTHVSVDHPPQVHQGHKLDRTDPETLCALAYEYLAELVEEASLAVA